MTALGVGGIIQRPGLLEFCGDMPCVRVCQRDRVLETKTKRVIVCVVVFGKSFGNRDPRSDFESRGRQTSRGARLLGLHAGLYAHVSARLESFRPSWGPIYAAHPGPLS